MKRSWTTDELIDYWTLLPGELELVEAARTASNQLGWAVLLKWFQYEGRFPRQKYEVPGTAVEFLARQLEVTPEAFEWYEWQGRTIERHRAQIRQFLGFREATVQDGQALVTWLIENVLPQQRNPEALKAALYDRCRTIRIEPPSPKRIERLIRSAVRTTDDRFYAATLAQLSPEVQKNLEALLVTEASDDETSDDTRTTMPGRSTLHDLKRGPGPVKLESLFTEVAKLQRIQALGLPKTLFAQVSPKVLHSYRQRVAVEALHEMRRHPDPVRYTLLAAYCWQRSREITDTLVDLLIDLVHRLGIKAERKVDKGVLKDLKRVRGKTRLLYEYAEAAVAHPDGIVREVVYPVAGEQTLRDLVTEFKITGAYDQQVQTTMRSSFGRHYRRMVPVLLEALTFRSNNEVHRPVIRALELLKKYATSPKRRYPASEEVPLEGVVPTGWRDLVLYHPKRGKPRVNRISYELCVLRALREKLRCKEIWVEGADRFRNPDEDLPDDFAQQRAHYYAELKQPLDAETFIAAEQKALQEALQMLDQGIVKNPKVNLTERQGKSWISLSPLDAQPEPANLTRLKAEIGRRWPWTSLLDILKETDLRVGFSDLFKSATVYEQFPQEMLQKRLLLCLYGLGTNTGLKRVSAGDPDINYRDLLYVRRRFISRDSLRAAITQVANAVLRARHPHIWGEETTACASDAKKFGAWDQNLLTEWHIRYRGPGVMVYWHLEKKSLCIYSQLKRCSSSEVAAMIEGVLRHCTDMTVEKNYVDSHGQSEVAFAFCHLLGFQLLPRLKGIGRQKLYRPESGDPAAYPNLQPVLTRAINWDIIRQQYDELIKYTTSLRLGTAEAEAILRRFTRSGLQHPTYKAMAELGKVRKTIFLCHYLHSEALRREIEEGLNVIENWNSANGFIFFGKGGEIATNQREDQELAILSLHLLQICLVYINTLMLQVVLGEPAWFSQMQTDDLRGLTPLFYGHVNPYGLFQLDMQDRLDLEPVTIS